MEVTGAAEAPITVPGPNGRFVSAFLNVCQDCPGSVAPGDRLATDDLGSPNYDILEAVVRENPKHSDDSDAEECLLILRLRVPNERARLCLENVGAGGSCEVRVPPLDGIFSGNILSTTSTHRDVEVMITDSDEPEFLQEARDEYDLEVLESDVYDKLVDSYQNQEAKEGVYTGFDDVPSGLRASLQSSIEEMSKVEKPDYHPGTRNVVRDFVHPSLYPYIEGVTRLAIPFKRSAHNSDFWKRPYEESIYQWLPAQFAVDEAGGCSIKTYINNLPKDKYPRLYADLERLFEIALPRFEAVYRYIHTVEFFGGDMESIDESSKPVPPGLSLRNRELQVVTKIVDYELSSGASFEGVWHVEGMSHENIIATSVYVIERSSHLEGGDLLFKRAFINDESASIFYNIPQERHEGAENLVSEGLVPIGRLATGEGRLIVFPNSHVHKVDTLVNAGLEPGRRRIIVFFLVNPEKKIVSTRNVELQQGVMPLSEALQHRLALMAERKRHKQDWNVRAIELCEH